MTGQAELRAYADAGIAKYRYVAVFDGRTCEKCQPLDGKEFPLEAQEIGVNMHPMHPWCRCSVSPVLPWNTQAGKEKWARDLATGEQTKIPQDMGFVEWKKQQNAAFRSTKNVKSGIIRLPEHAHYKGLYDAPDTAFIERYFRWTGEYGNEYSPIDAES